METYNLTTCEFAQQLLSRPNIVHTFFAKNDWYDIVCARILEPQSVLISGSDDSTEKPHVFNLLYYNRNDALNAAQSPECLVEMVAGLEQFDSQPIWVVAKHGLGRINMQYKKIN